MEQDEAVGHAVRATYMYAGMADVAALTGDTAYIHAIDRIWDNIVGKKYYITGGIGATDVYKRQGQYSGAFQQGDVGLPDEGVPPHDGREPKEQRTENRFYPW